MDDIITQKTAAIDAIISDLTDNFIKKFWEQIEELYKVVHLHERQALVWKAISKKEEFTSAIQALREMFVNSLAETRSTLVNELNEERNAFSTFIGE